MSVKAILASVCACFLFLAMAQVGTAQQAGLPTWNVGDTWVMGKPDIDLTFTTTSEGMTIGTSGNGSYYVIYKVVGAEGQEYTVDLTGGLEIIMDMNISGSYLGEQVSGSMRMTMVAKVDGTLYYTKDELALTRTDETIDLDMELSGSVTAVGQTQSFSGSMDVTGGMSTTFNPALDFFEFPITVGESWTANSTAMVTGSMSGTMRIDGVEQSISEPLGATVNVSLSVSCPSTEDIQLASTCYKIVVSGTGMEQASPFMPANVLYYSPDRGFIVAAELSFNEAMRGASLGSEETLSPMLGTTTGAMFSPITLESVTEQEARDAIAGMGAKGIDIVLIGAIVAVVAVVVVVIAAVVFVARRRRAVPV